MGHRTRRYGAAPILVNDLRVCDALAPTASAPARLARPPAWPSLLPSASATAVGKCGDRKAGRLAWSRRLGTVVAEDSTKPSDSPRRSAPARACAPDVPAHRQ